MKSRRGREKGIALKHEVKRPNDYHHGCTFLMDAVLYPVLEMNGHLNRIAGFLCTNANL